MTSTPTQRLRLEQQGTGDNPNAWGIRLNAGLALIDESQGVATVPVSGNVALTTNNFITDQARRAVLVFTGPGLAGNAPAVVTIPSVEKWYVIDNRCTGDVQLGLANGQTATLRAGTAVVVYSDGATIRVVDTTLDRIARPVADVDLGGFKLANAAAGVLGTDVARLDQTGPFQVAQARAWASQGSTPVADGLYSARFYAEQTLAMGTAGRASKAQAEEGTDGDTYMTPLRSAQVLKARADFLFCLART